MRFLLFLTTCIYTRQPWKVWVAKQIFANFQGSWIKCDSEGWIFCGKTCFFFNSGSSLWSGQGLLYKWNLFFWGETMVDAKMVLLSTWHFDHFHLFFLMFHKSKLQHPLIASVFGGEWGGDLQYLGRWKYQYQFGLPPNPRNSHHQDFVTFLGPRIPT